jgi:hypothetical protein
MTTRSDKFLETYTNLVGKPLDEAATVDLKGIADDIEGLAAYVADDDEEKFNSLLDKFLSPVDPKAQMTLGDAVEKLGAKGAKALMKELEGLNYEDPDEEDEGEEDKDEKD